MNMEFKPNDKFRVFSSLFGSLGMQGKGNGLGILQQGVADNGTASTLYPPPSYYQSSGAVVSALKTKNDNNSRNLRANVDMRYEPIPGVAIASSRRSVGMKYAPSSPPSTMMIAKLALIQASPKL